jgi:PAT family beta-lactamase induction signal transducer AmpG
MDRRWRKLACITLLGFSSGLPLALTGATLKIWMKKEGVDLGVIGLFSLVALPYSLKFLWSPLMDRYRLPLLGRRRGWVVLTQLALVLTISLMAMLSPALMPRPTAVIAVLVAFFSASQDIVIDAYKVDVLDEHELGMGVALANAGYRVAMLVSGSLALILADHLPWRLIYLMMAAAMSIGVVGTLVAPEPVADSRPPRNLRDAVVLPFVEFFGRPGAFEVVLFALLYKLDAVLTVSLTGPFLLEKGFSLASIGAVANIVGMVATIAGSLVGGALMIRWTMGKALWIFGWLQGLSGLSFVLLARLGHNYPMMVISNGLENFCSGLGTTAYTAFLMSLCDKRYTATQFALLTSLAALTRTLGAAPAGYMAKAFGWETFYLIGMLAGVPALLMLYRNPKWATLREA